MVVQTKPPAVVIDADDVIRRIRRVIGDRPDTALHEPTLGGREWEYVKETLDTGWVSSAGSFVSAFENALAEHSGVSHAVVTGTGTAAIHVALLACGVERGDEVLLPALTFVATANAVSYLGAIPHFCDSESETFGINAERLDEHLQDIAVLSGDACINKHTGNRIRALLPMHVLGCPCEIDRLAAVAEKWRLELLIDAAEAVGSRYAGRDIGGFGRASMISFNGNKIITTGGGGAVLTDDADLARRIKHLTTTAREPHPWRFGHDEVGYNYRLPNINAALGLAQLEQIDRFLKLKRLLHEHYVSAFQGARGLSIFREPEGREGNCWLNVMLLDVPDRNERDTLLAATHEAGIGTRPVWDLMHTLVMYEDCPRMEMPVAEALYDRIICLPSSASLESAETS